MSNNAKICPGCQFRNAASNLACLKCEDSLIHVGFEASFTEQYTQEFAERAYFFEEFFNPTLIVCIPVAIVSILLGAFTMGTSLMPVFFTTGVILAALPFFPGDPVGDYMRSRIDAHQGKQLKEQSPQTRKS